MGMKLNFVRKRDVMEHFGYFSWIQRPKVYRNQLQNWRQFFGRLPVLPVLDLWFIELGLLAMCIISKIIRFCS